MGNYNIQIIFLFQLPYNFLYETDKSPGGKLLAYFRQNQMLILIFEESNEIDLQKLKIFLDKNLVLKGKFQKSDFLNFIEELVLKYKKRFSERFIKS